MSPNCTKLHRFAPIFSQFPGLTPLDPQNWGGVKHPPQTPPLDERPPTHFFRVSAAAWILVILLLFWLSMPVQLIAWKDSISKITHYVSSETLNLTSTTAKFCFYIHWNSPWKLIWCGTRELQLLSVQCKWMWAASDWPVNIRCPSYFSVALQCHCHCRVLIVTSRTKTVQGGCVQGGCAGFKMNVVRAIVKNTDCC